METTPSKSFQRGRERGPGIPVLVTPTQQITALPVHSYRASQSSPNASHTTSQGRVLSHHPQASYSSQISQDPFLHRHRGSTLKVVMRKLFGLKRQSNLETEEESESQLTVQNQIMSSQMISFPIAQDLTHGGKAHQSDTTSKHSALKRKQSLPNSHISSASSDRLGTTIQDSRIEIPAQTVRRRATLPSLILTEDDDLKSSIYSDISPVSTRPVSMINESHEEPELHTDHEESKSQPSFKSHRRSKSADALRDLVRHHRMSPIQWRRRSDEIRFWRTSIFETDESDDNGKEELPQDESLQIVESPVHPKTASVKAESVPLQSELKPAHFQLENLITNIADPDATVEERLATIEVKLMDLEFAISKIQGTDHNVFSKSTNEPAVLEDLPLPVLSPGHCSADASSILSDVSTQSSASFGGGEDRPLSTATLRPNIVYAQQPPPTHNYSWSSLNLNGISIEQYSALVTLIRREQTARKALEDQVTQLQEEMEDFRRGSGMPASPPGTLYPIPSPDSDDSKFRRRHTDSSRKGSSASGDTRASDVRTREGSKYRLTRETPPRLDTNLI